LRVSGEFVDSPVSQRVLALARAGVPLQLSVGAEPFEQERFAADTVFKANGKQLTAGQYGTTVVRRAALREISVVAVGADGQTSLSVKGSAMEFEQWVAARGFDPNTLSEPQRASLTALYNQQPAEPGDNDQAALRAEHDRIQRIELVAARNADNPHVQAVARQAVSDGWSVPRAELEMMRASRLPGPSFSINRGGSGYGTKPDHLAAAVMVKAGYSAAAEKAFGPVVMEQSRRLHSASLVDLCRAALIMDGRDPDAFGSRDKMLRAAVSTGSLPTALGSSADKTLMSVYTVAPASWRSFAMVKSAANFRTQTAIRPSFLGNLDQVAPGGEVKHGFFAEDDTYAWAVKQYAKQLVIDRTSIINDDLSAFSDALPSMARAAARTLNDLVATTLLGGISTFWTTALNNYQEGSGTALSSASLASAIALLRKQTDAAGNLLDLEPFALLVPPELEQTGRELIQSSEVQRVATGDRQPTGNVHQKVAELVVEPRLSNSNYSGYSTTAWWLFASPSEASVIVGFLNGVEAPTAETFDLGIDHLGVGLRVVFDFGAALGDSRGSVRSKGAA
jgi:hypothetical protein